LTAVKGGKGVKRGERKLPRLNLKEGSSSPRRGAVGEVHLKVSPGVLTAVKTQKAQLC
jgi:hypothetical protein